MTKFSKGDKVRVVSGEREGRTGVVTDPAWQTSQSDWPCVEIMADDGMYAYVDEDNLGLTEDPYEYNIERTSGVTGKTYLYFGQDGWDDNRRSVEQEYNELLVADSTRLMNNKYRFVKRRKAGRIEDV